MEGHAFASLWRYMHEEAAACDSLEKGSHLGMGMHAGHRVFVYFVFLVEFIFAILKTNVVFLKHILKISIIGMHGHCVFENLAYT